MLYVLLKERAMSYTLTYLRRSCESKRIRRGGFSSSLMCLAYDAFSACSPSCRSQRGLVSQSFECRAHGATHQDSDTYTHIHLCTSMYIRQLQTFIDSRLISICGCQRCPHTRAYQGAVAVPQLLDVSVECRAAGGESARKSHLV
jgi:hypothetical protein